MSQCGSGGKYRKPADGSGFKERDEYEITYGIESGKKVNRCKCT